MSINNIPGNKNLIAGDGNAGYLGTVLSTELITGDVLSNQIGLAAGSNLNSTVNWLKFVIDGKIIFSPMKAIKSGLSWNQINSANAVYGNTIVTINGLRYKVRLWRGANEDPVSVGNGSINHNSEWNRLMLPINVKAKSKNWSYPNNVESNVPDWDIGFTDEDLLMGAVAAGYSWCQEIVGSSSRLYRGGGDASRSDYLSSSYIQSFVGWRPVLELVDYTFEDTQNQAPTIIIKNSFDQQIVQNQVIKHSNKTPVSFKILANDSDLNDTLQYSIWLRNSEYKTWAEIGKSVEINVSIPFENILVGNNTIQVKVRDNNGAETSITFVVANINPQSYSQKHVYELIMALGFAATGNNSLRALKYPEYNKSTLSLAELVNFLQ